VDNIVICTTKGPLLDLKTDKLGELVSTRVAVSHAIINNEKDDEVKVENMKKEIETIRNQVFYFKETQDAMTKFIDDVLHEENINYQIKGTL